MAVSRVFGRVDGAEVVMEQTQGEIWQVPVPLDQDGEYVVEIIAEDEAGNQSYMAKMLFAVNTALLCAHMIPVPYYASLMEPVLRAQIMPPQYYTEIIEPVCDLAGRR